MRARGRRPLLAWTALIVTVIYLVPVYWMVNTSFKKADDIFVTPPHLIPVTLTLTSYQRAVFSDPDIARGLMNSAIIAVGTTVITLLVALPAAYGLARLRVRFVSLFLMLFLAVQMVPSVNLALPMFVLFSGLGLVNSYIGLIIANCSLAIPLAVTILRPYFLTIPQEIVEAAKVEGCNEVSAFWRIAIPVTTPGVVTVTVVSFLGAWGEFVFGLSLATSERYQPITVVLAAITNAFGTRWERPDGSFDDRGSTGRGAFYLSAALHRGGINGGGDKELSRLEIWAATPTPYDATGRLDVSTVPAQADHLRQSGVRGAFVGGTTGEWPALSRSERRALLEAWADARDSDLGLAAHVGSNELGEAAELASHAATLGVDFIAAVPPFYGQPSTVDPVIRHLSAIAAAAPTTPLCYYHIPSMTGSTLRPTDIVAAAHGEIPTLTAVKFTDGDLMELDRLKQTGVKIYFGRDELLPAGLAFGVQAVIGSLFNGLAPAADEVVEAWDQGQHRHALDLHQPFRAIAAASSHYGGLGFVKEVLNVMSPNCGPARTPWGPIDDVALSHAHKLGSQLRRVGERTSATVEEATGI